MKKKNILWLIAFALLMPLFVLTACSDDDDDDNDNDTNGDKTEQTAKDGTKVLSKKLTKIVRTNKDASIIKTFHFDEYGRFVNYIRTEIDGDKEYSSDRPMFYTDKRITSSLIDYNLENGRVVSSDYHDGDWTEETTYNYSADGYILSSSTKYGSSERKVSSTATYNVKNGKLESVEEKYVAAEGYEDYNEVTTYTYGNVLNNLNVDLFWFFGEAAQTEEPVPFGVRFTHLPILVTEVETQGGAEVYTETTEYTYEFDGDYISKVRVRFFDSEGDTSNSTLEFFYE